MKRFSLIGLLFIGLSLIGISEQRIDTSTYETPGGQLMALYTLNQGPGPFQLLNPPTGAIFLGPNKWAVPVPKSGIPSLQFKVGTQVHRSVAVK